MTCTLWGTSVAGWATDYVILFVCLVAVWFETRRLRMTEGLREEALFLIFIGSTGLSFGLGGTAHLMLFLVEQRGGACGSSFSEANSGWLYPWLASMLLGPLSPAALLGLATSSVGLGCYSVLTTCAFAVAVQLSIIEVALVKSLRLDVSGLPVAMWGLLASSCAGLIFIIGGCRLGFTTPITYGILSCMMYTSGVLTVQLLTLPAFFNANATCHLCIALAVLLAVGHRRSHDPSQAVEDKQGGEEPHLDV